MNSALENLFAAVGTIRDTASTVIPNTAKWVSDEAAKKWKKIEKFQGHLDKDGNGYLIQSAHEAAELLDATRQLKEFPGTQMIHTLEKSLFTQLFSEFDSFTGTLLAAIYTSKSDLLKSISREVSFADLLQFENLDAVKLNMLEKEIETFRRDSYVEQFASLEKKFGLKLREFREWGEFVELSQRRNLLTHCGGKVSEQYLLICEREGCRFEKRPVLGEVLRVDAKYFYRATRLIMKVGFMLTHTLWRKLFPNEVELQSRAMSDAIYSVLQQKRWRLAAELAEFSLTDAMRKNVQEIHLRVRVVNAAIALKFSDRNEEALRLLDSMDWSASYRDFKLAIAVMNDDFDGAADIMRQIGKNGELVNELNYHEWPLFHKFRESEQFQGAYKDIYDISFSSKVVEDSQAAKPVIEDVKIRRKPRAKVVAGPTEITDERSAKVKIGKPAPRRPIARPHEKPG
ncbi:hypothetical protein [Ramlibacter sp.]|uniref:hypothetical protein n=1 Tax=Ramlibacter sp. TaxID=1917967 RepID=UPI002D4E47D6|nr:hypothetical protein [Ramlibacter sp.]HYD77792.1 hypothetical protein [Ramlibacter sp.]